MNWTRCKYDDDRWGPERFAEWLDTVTADDFKPQPPPTPIQIVDGQHRFHGFRLFRDQDD